ncbi:MAG: phospho-N-acetylmuramoyl-pentapeptide-transferase [Lachnospiraceae bacterium]|nr:phospho-N-acetylmuramoyl-pentapeptide-transferase [Lachnospiraceae bacterium]
MFTDYQVIIPVVIAFVISVVLGPIMIPILKKIKIGQMVRDDGPSSHLKKAGTPTMGGLFILGSILITSLLYVKDYPKIIPILFTVLGFGLIGFLDDYLKVVLKRSLGLKAWQKMLGQFLVTGILAFYLVNVLDTQLAMKIPFTNGIFLDFGHLNIPLLFFIVIGCVNGTNFTDGLDGLLGSVTVLVATFFAVVSIGMEAGIAPLACAVVGALLGFLLFNVHPASVFMGDTGSLALGGFVAASAYLTQLQLFIPIVGFVYVIEVVSVIIQVGYFKLSGGKRVFKMAPIHHHFELCGWKETKVVAVFSIITAILCIIGLIGLN